MGWRTKLAAVAVLGAGIGVGALYLKDYRIQSQPGDKPAAGYAETAAIKLDSGQPIQVRVDRCDLGMAQQHMILKVYGQVVNLGQAEIPRRLYWFDLLDGYGRLYGEQNRLDSPAANSFTLAPGEKRGFVFRYLIEPISIQSSLDLAMLSGTARTNRLVQVKTSQPLDRKLAEGEWHAFHEARW